MVRRSLKEDKRLIAERRGEMDLRFVKWQVRPPGLRAEPKVDVLTLNTSTERQAWRIPEPGYCQRRRRRRECFLLKKRWGDNCGGLRGPVAVKGRAERWGSTMLLEQPAMHLVLLYHKTIATIHQNFTASMFFWGGIWNVQVSVMLQWLRIRI